MRLAADCQSSVMPLRLTWSGYGQVCWLQEPLVESAKGSSAIDQVHLDDPVLHLSQGVRVAHPVRVRWADPIEIFVAGNARVWKFANDMAGDRAAEQPAGRFRTLLGVGIKLGARDIAMIIEILLESVEYPWQIPA